MPTNYEAIGRCKVLDDEIAKLMRTRSSKLSALSVQLESTAEYQSMRFTVPSVNTEAFRNEIKEIDTINELLREKAQEHNEWADAAEVSRITFE
ncbi:hypothetical protein [Vreelandella titanicae]|uniref:hypothetical protein n=1 Tax=Vreelandella titanicae TaxID=664683 RepID=UPI003FD6EF43